ncbi:MAG: NmrA family NAD(P)-binding protein, partial [Alphaproteobacteria bacterium]|nr:NmrA family NAD(P)-binding protein [Alphaproteobacteria bacterium]
MTDCITVFGGTGFIGRHLVALLLHSGTTVRVAVRDPGGAKMAVEATNSPEIVQ